MLNPSAAASMVRPVPRPITADKDAIDGSPGLEGAPWAINAGSRTSARNSNAASPIAPAITMLAEALARNARWRRGSNVKRVVRPRDENSAPISDAPKIQPTSARAPPDPWRMSRRRLA